MEKIKIKEFKPEDLSIRVENHIICNSWGSHPIFINDEKYDRYAKITLQCYTKASSKSPPKGWYNVELKADFWLDIVPYLERLTGQSSWDGIQPAPYLHPDEVSDISVIIVGEIGECSNSIHLRSKDLTFKRVRVDLGPKKDVNLAFRRLPGGIQWGYPLDDGSHLWLPGPTNELLREIQPAIDPLHWRREIERLTKESQRTIKVKVGTRPFPETLNNNPLRFVPKNIQFLLEEIPNGLPLQEQIERNAFELLVKCLEVPYLERVSGYRDGTNVEFEVPVSGLVANLGREAEWVRQMITMRRALDSL